ncbi:MAG: gliding motility-associated C-terminal domain-containing protein [Lacibacter sp.]
MKTWLLFLSLLITVSANAQLETANWFLAQNHTQVTPAGVTFGLPIPAQNVFNTGRRTASVSDAQGNLLFACNGATIIDRNLTPMPALASATLNSTADKILIQQIPGTSRYYVFYTKRNNVYQPNTSATLSYAIVDMSLNGGKGDAVQFNQLVDTASSPAFTLVQQDVSNAWLVTHRHGTGDFYAYQITNSGLAATAVQSSVGSIADPSEYIFWDMKTSFNGKMIAGASYFDETGLFALTKGLVQVFDFENATGQIRNKVRTRHRQEYFAQIQSLEFSADNRLLYHLRGTTVYGLQPCGFSSGSITQFNLCYTDSVQFDRYKMGVGSNFQWCNPGVLWVDIQMGADKRLHLPYNGINVSTISFPNRIGSSSTYAFTGYNLPNQNWGQKTTPDFSHYLMEKAVKNNIIYKGRCYPNPITFSVTNDTITKVEWDFGDAASASNTAATLQASHVFSAPGLYTVKAKLYNSNNQLIEEIQELVEAKDPGKRLLDGYPADTTICAGSGFEIKLNVVNGIYFWYSENNGQRYDEMVDDVRMIQYPGKVYVEMRQSDCDGCIMIDSINVNVLERPSFNLGPNQNLCSGDSLLLQSYDTRARYKWSTGDTGRSVSIKTGGLYWVEAEYENNGCPFRDSIVITEVPGVRFALPGDTVLCNNETLVLQPGISNAYYQWQDGSSNSTYMVTGPGTYYVRIRNDNYCTYSDTINVSYVSGAQVKLGNDTTLCAGSSLLLKAGVSNATYVWSTGSVTENITVTTAGSYWVKVSNANCTVSDTIHVDFAQPPVLQLGKDTVLCAGQSLLLQPGISNARYQWQNGSAAVSYTVTQAGLYWVEVEKNSCIVRDSINVSYYPAMVVQLGPDAQFCQGDSLLLDAGAGFANYSWSNGKTGRQIYVKAAGNYSVAAASVNGCVSRDTMHVTGLYQLPQVNLGNMNAICPGETKLLNAGTGFANYQWSTGDQSSSITINQLGTYYVAVTNQQGCKASDTVTVQSFYTLPAQFLPADTTICTYDKLTLNPSSNFQSYLWSTNSSTKTITITQPGTYWLTVTDANSCTGADTVRVTPKDCLAGLFVPNAFTPNSDGLNDELMPVFGGVVAEMEFSVFNRWGQLVFRTTEKGKGWNGTLNGIPQTPGLYAWRCIYRFVNEVTKKAEGSFILIH